jgi:hypothetical protein
MKDKSNYQRKMEEKYDADELWSYRVNEAANYLIFSNFVASSNIICRPSFKGDE